MHNSHQIAELVHFTRLQASDNILRHTLLLDRLIATDFDDHFHNSWCHFHDLSYMCVQC